MRTVHVLALSALVAVPLACSRDSAEATPPASSGITTVVLDVGGMTSGVDCPPRVARMLSGIAGVERVDVDFETRTATVMIRDGVDPSALSRALAGQYIGALRAEAR